MLREARNDKEAKLAIEASLNAVLTPVKIDVGMSTANQGLTITGLHVREEPSISKQSEPTGQIQILGYTKNLKQRGKLMSPLVITLDKESAKALANAILAQL